MKTDAHSKTARQDNEDTTCLLMVGRCWRPISFANQSTVTSPKDVPPKIFFFFSFLFFLLVSINCTWRRVGGLFLHLKCTKINVKVFKRKTSSSAFEGIQSHVEQNRLYSKCLHARWHRHWCWLGVSLCGSSVRRQEHCGNCELSQTRQSTGFLFFFLKKKKQVCPLTYRVTSLDAHIFKLSGGHGPRTL